MILVTDCFDVLCDVLFFVMTVHAMEVSATTCGIFTQNIDSVDSNHIHFFINVMTILCKVKQN